MSSPITLIRAASHVALPADKALQIYDLMVRARVLEERLITMYKQGDGYFSIAIGTARAQRKGSGAKGITIVQGGDAGTAEGDFATALVWASRKGCELPLLMIVTNNRFGISTTYEGQHGYEQISERGKAFGMPTAVVDGNDPEASYAALEKALAYVRTERKPYLLEAMVSRLRGHSSASGANLV